MFINVMVISPPSARRAMFIEHETVPRRPRQDGNVLTDAIAFKLTLPS